MARGRKKFISPSPKQLKSVKHSEYRTLDVYAGAYSNEYLRAVRRALAKQANQRVVRLERARSSITGERFNEFGAVVDVYSYLESRNRRRFSEQISANLTDAQLRHEIVVLQGFLGRKSSTVAGMKEIEKKRVRTFESKGLKFASTKEFYDFLNSETFRSLTAAGFTSEQLIEAYDQAREKKSDEDVLTFMQGALDKYRSGEQKVSIKSLQKALGVKIIKKR